MPELIKPKIHHKPLRFHRLLTSQGLLLQAALPQRHPPNLRKHQALQVLDAATQKPLLVEGRPRMYTYDVLRDITHAHVYEDVVQEARGGDPDAEVLQVFFEFLQAVRDTYPLGLRELCSEVGVDVVATAAGISATQLTSRLRGVSRMQLKELYDLHKAFPQMDLHLALEEVMTGA